MRRIATLHALLIGAGAGLLASFVMEQAQEALSKLERAESGGEPSTVKAADRASLAMTGKPVPEAERKQAGRLVHYSLGAALGAAYALAAEHWRGVTAGFGALFGLTVSIGLDEIGVPALGLSPPPSQTPAVGHLNGLAAHLVFGITLEGARRVLRAGTTP